MRLPAITEKQFQAQVMQLAKLRGWNCYHTHDSRKSAAGFPDLVLVRRKVLYAELKSEKGELSPEQERWIAALLEAGQEVYLWRPSDWPEIMKVLE